MILTLEQLRTRFTAILELLEEEGDVSVREELLSELEGLKIALKNYKFE